MWLTGNWTVLCACATVQRHSSSIPRRFIRHFCKLCHLEKWSLFWDKNKSDHLSNWAEKLENNFLNPQTLQGQQRCALSNQDVVKVRDNLIYYWTNMHGVQQRMRAQFIEHDMLGADLSYLEAWQRYAQRNTSHSRGKCSTHVHSIINWIMTNVSCRSSNGAINDSWSFQLAYVMYNDVYILLLKQLFLTNDNVIPISNVIVQIVVWGFVLYGVYDCTHGQNIINCERPLSVCKASGMVYFFKYTIGIFVSD